MGGAEAFSLLSIGPCWSCSSLFRFNQLTNSQRSELKTAQRSAMGNQGMWRTKWDNTRLKAVKFVSLVGRSVSR